MTIDQAIEAFVTEAQNGRYIERRPRDTLLSSDGDFCLSEPALKLFSQNRDRDIYLPLVADWGTETRRFLRVLVGEKPYFADAITGSLYHPSGRSASGSPLRLQVTA